MPSVNLMSGNSLDFDFKPDIIIDGILGTGISGEIREPYASAINYINNTDCYKFAVDVPSGLDPQTGNTANIFTKCDMTVTFHKMKEGIPKRKDLTGELLQKKLAFLLKLKRELYDSTSNPRWTNAKFFLHCS